MGQHRTGNAVADGVDARNRGLEVLIDLDEAAVGHGDTQFLQAEAFGKGAPPDGRSEEHTSELQSLMRISYAVFCLKKKTSPIHISSCSMFLLAFSTHLPH